MKFRLIKISSFIEGKMDKFGNSEFDRALDKYASNPPTYPPANKILRVGDKVLYEKIDNLNSKIDELTKVIKELKDVLVARNESALSKNKNNSATHENVN